MINLKSFTSKATKNKTVLSKFLKKFDKKFVPSMLQITTEIDKQVWAETDCLSCANCCKTMTPTYLPADIKRIAAHLQLSTKQVFEKWLMKDPDNSDIVNQTTPCQWLNLKTNKCKIYAVRPADCSSFPHHLKKRFDNYNHVYQQNLDKCPATYNLVVKLKEKIEADFVW